MTEAVSHAAVETFRIGLIFLAFGAGFVCGYLWKEQR